MTPSEQFAGFLSNLAIKNAETISLRYGELTSALNKAFRDTESKTGNTLQVGSFGRSTGINGISDLDMLYIMPKRTWADYEQGGQRKLLLAVSAAIQKRYPKTDVRVDRLVVTVTYTDFHVEVQPVYEQEDRSYKYPDTKGEGAWKITKTREEMAEIARLDTEKNGNLRRLCKMTRAWKNKHGVGMGGLLIDSLSYNFLSNTDDYDDVGVGQSGAMMRAFVDYLSGLPKQGRYDAPGSRQHVRSKRLFQRKAGKARKLCDRALESKTAKSIARKWRAVFGRPFPLVEVAAKAVNETSKAWDDTEQFIEDKYPVDIRSHVSLDCRVTQAGFRSRTLRDMIARCLPLMANKSLEFWVEDCDVVGDYSIEWKVLNRGEEARRRNMVRGQIVEDRGRRRLTDSTTFRGDHVVECYVVQSGVVVAKTRIHVPIESNSESK